MEHLDQRQMYSTALHTMRAVADSLRDLPDPDGVLAALLGRIDRERAWVTAEMCLGLRPQPPPPWLVREPRRATPTP